MRALVIASAMCLSTLGIALATDARAAIRMPTNIQAQELGAALQALAKSREFQIVYRPEYVRDRTTSGAAGELTRDEALARILADTGLTFRYLNENTVTIEPFGADRNTGSAPTRSSEPADAVERSSSFWSRLRLAQSDSPSSSQGEGKGKDRAAGEKESTAEEYEPQAGKGIPEILVRGKKFSLNADIERTRDDIQPYVVLDRKAIEQSGATTVNDLLRSRLPMNYMRSSSLQDSSAVGSGNESSISLRGLDSSQTLILIDGRRAGLRGIVGTESQADINGIPLSAIERIEVLPTTASGIYGGSATGGVVNVVLRRDYTGIETSLNYENSFRNDGTTRRADVSGGFSLAGGKTSVQFTGSYSDADPLFAGDRNFFYDNKRRVYANRIAANPNYLASLTSPPLGATTNIRSTTGAPLVLDSAYGGAPLNSSFTSVPYGYQGVSSDNAAALLANAGRYNLDPAQTAQSGGARATLLGQPLVRAASVTVRQKLSPTIEAFMDLSGSSNYSSFNSLGMTGTFTLQPNAAANPFQQPIRVTTPIMTPGDETRFTKSQARRGLLGIIVQLSDNWSAEVDYAVDRADIEQTTTPMQFSAAAGTSISAGSTDVLRDTNAFPSDLTSFIIPGFSVAPSHSLQQDATIHFAGPVGQLPGGRPTVSMLYEYRQQDYSEFTQVSYNAAGTPTPTLYSDQSSGTHSLYLETRVPLISELNRMRGVQRLDLQVAARYDRYRQVGGGFLTDAGQANPDTVNTLSSFDPTIGLQYKPVSGLTLRSSFGTGFLPPGLNQLTPNAPLPFASGFVDPKRGGEVLAEVMYASGGSPSLQPEQSESLSAGFVLNPTFVPALRVSADWTRISKQDNITTIAFSQNNLNQEDLLPGVFTRGPVEGRSCTPVCPITGFNGAFINAVRAETESYDFSVDYVQSTRSLGTFSFAATGTRLLHNQVQTAPTLPALERVGVQGMPDWQGVATFDWRKGRFSAGWTTQYLDAIWITSDRAFNVAQGADHLSSATFHDVATRYEFEDLFGASSNRLESLVVSLGVKNIFDKRPRFYGSFVNTYDPSTSPKMATYYVTVRAAL